ncbi:MAG: hypothetical protein Q4G26_01970 [Paracoccus sp. (in: a-proteobacteria)]|nr:hypothetical protein [Paracoccus sp. (in: a-proteobacteria)]
MFLDTAGAQSQARPRQHRGENIAQAAGVDGARRRFFLTDQAQDLAVLLIGAPKHASTVIASNHRRQLGSGRQHPTRY